MKTPKSNNLGHIPSKLFQGVALAPLVLCAALTIGCASRPVAAPIDETAMLSNVTQLTKGYLRAGEAYFSHDRRFIVFQAIAEGQSQYQMFVAPTIIEDDSITGLGPAVQVSPDESRNTCGYFSSDGRTLIFASTAGKEVPDEPAPGYQRAGATYRWSFPRGMEIYRADGFEAAMSGAVDAKIDLARFRLTDNSAYDAECAISSDGRFIVFASDRTESSDEKPDLELYVMNLDGSNVVRLTRSPGYDGGPFFSPDGKRLVYRSDRAGNDLLQVYVADLVFDAQGNITGLTDEKPLTADSHVNWGPYWHPSGRYVIYASSEMGHDNYELFLIDVNDGRRCRVTFSAGFDGLPVFSADGKHLMWSSKRGEDKRTQVFVARFELPAYMR